MLTYLRYALATFSFAVSVGCLALWGWTVTNGDRVYTARCLSPALGWHLDSGGGTGIFTVGRTRNQLKWKWSVDAGPLPDWDAWFAQKKWPRTGVFGSLEWGNFAVYFPLWYPTLIFALAGAASLRLGRRFTLRSAIIATTVVAGLLGMAVAL